MGIELKALRCGYHGRPLTDGIDAVFSAGQVSCILGPNGVGKTTLFRTVQGNLPPVDGQVLIDGKPPADYDKRMMADKIAYVPQVRSQPFAYSAFNMVLMGRVSHLKLFSSPGQIDREIAYETMEQMGIAHLAAKNFTQLSGGEQQMVLIARALAQQPKFLMMDEPTSNLDYGNQMQVLRQILMLSHEKGIGIIMITHSPEHAFLSSDQVVLFFRNGKISIGNTEQTLTSDSLRQAYGIPVEICQVQNAAGISVTACVPFIN